MQRIGSKKRGRFSGLIQVGNPGTPSNEKDRLSYFTRSHLQTHTNWDWIHTHRGKSDDGHDQQPTHHPYICVLKGIPEYILHMLYYCLIFNSMVRPSRMSAFHIHKGLCDLEPSGVTCVRIVEDKDEFLIYMGHCGQILDRMLREYK